jgi:hypothetical protein
MGVYLELIPFESEHPVLKLDVCEVQRSSARMRVECLAYLPSMEGGHTCVTWPILRLGVKSCLRPHC